VEDVKPVKLVNSDIVEPQLDDYRELDRPTVLRNGAAARQSSVTKADGNLDYLDIPAFLRRQAD
jgi:cell division protein FtsZ